jgi:hypothetical protein
LSRCIGYYGEFALRFVRRDNFEDLLRRSYGRVKRLNFTHVFLTAQILETQKDVCKNVCKSIKKKTNKKPK